MEVADGIDMAKLKGINRIRKFRRTADKLVSKISSLEGISGIALIGGLTRGFTDKFSDLDVVVFLNEDDDHLKTQVHNARLDEEKRSGIEIDLEMHLVEHFKAWNWDEIDKREFSRAEIVFDPDGKIKKLFEEKLSVPKDYWIKRVAVFIEYLTWYGCPPQENVGTISESWIERGDLVSAHYCLNYSVELLLKILFALNKEFLPPPKWIVFDSCELEWLPNDYRKLIKEATCTKSFTTKDFKRRLNAIRKMWSQTVPKIEEETKMTIDQIRKYSFEHDFRLFQYVE